MKSKIYLILFALLISSHAFALEEIIKNYRGVRSLGMGGVVTTTGHYDEALYGNPATQMEVESSKLTVFGMTLEANDTFVGSFNDISDILNASGSAVVSKIAEKELAGKNQHARFTLLMPGYFNPKFFGENTGFSFGFLVNLQANVMLRSNAEVDAQGVLDAGPAIGVGHRFFDGKLDVGANLRTVYRLGVDRGIRAMEFLTGTKISASSIGGQGVGVDGDIGAFYELPFKIPVVTKKMSIGFSVNNVAGTEYRVTGKEIIKSVKNRPPSSDRSFNFGTRLDMPDLLFLNNNLFAVEFQDFGQTKRQISFWKKMHMGAETTILGKLIALRAGLNQGYIGGGIGIDLPVIKIDFATYGEELGANTGQLEDRRFALRLSFDI